jgi:cytoskeletal protein RodZ
MRAIVRRPQPATVISLIALFVALGGTGYAALAINGASIKRNTVSGNRLKANTLTGREVRESKLTKVPSATKADSATTATRATTATKATTADTATKATTADTATKATTADTATNATNATNAVTAQNALTLGGLAANQFAPSDLITFQRQPAISASGELGRDSTVGVVVTTDATGNNDTKIAIDAQNNGENVAGHAQCGSGLVAVLAGDSPPAGTPTELNPCPGVDLTTTAVDFTVTLTNVVTLRSMRMECAAGPIGGAGLIRCWTLHLKQ